MAVLDVVKTQQKGRGLDGRETTARRGASGTWCDQGPRPQIGDLQNLQDWVQAPPPPRRLVPLLTNCWFRQSEVQSRGGQPLRLVVACYRQFSQAVDGANQIALQLCIITGQMTRASAVLVLILRYADASAFASCKALGSLERGTTLWEFRWDIIRHCYFPVPKWYTLTMSPQVVHAPLKVARKQLCSHCRTTMTARCAPRPCTSSALARRMRCRPWRTGARW